MVQNVNPYEVYSGPQSAESPGGFVFGQQGWTWGNPVPKSITFFLDNTAKVSDQHGRAIRGVVGIDNKPIMFAPGPATFDDNQRPIPRPEYATHKVVIAALTAENVKWLTLTMAGWPQLTYEELLKIYGPGVDPKHRLLVPPTPKRELRKILDTELRQAALRLRQESDEARAAEMRLIHEDEE